MRHRRRYVIGILSAVAVSIGAGLWYAQTHNATTPPSEPPSTSGSTAPTAAAPEPCKPSCEPMPRGDVRGWSQVFADDFSTDVGLGGFPGSEYGDRWSVYKDGWSDTTGNGTYMPSKVLSVRRGRLDMFLHTENGVHMVSAPVPRVPASKFGQYSVRFRADSMPGYKTAWLLWPDSALPPDDVEISWPDGDLDETAVARIHHPNRSADEIFPTTARFTDWHVATTTWKHGKVTFELDGKVIGTSGPVPDRPMHWVLQTETSTDPGVVPDDSTQGHVEIDWVVAYTMDAGSPPTPSSRESIVLGAVGDINPDGVSDTSSSAGLIASSVRDAGVDALAVLGDFQYEYGDCDSLVGEYDETGMGALMPKTIGTAGPTHDWSSFSDQDNYRRHMAGTCPGQTSGRSLSSTAWGSDVGPETSHWVDLGAWRVFSVSSGLWRYDTGAAEEVTSWLDTELAKGESAGDHMVVIWHEPYWTSDSEGHGRTTELEPWVDLLDEYGVRLVLSGHQHGYERFHPQDANGERSEEAGIQQFIVGSGGIGFYPWESVLANSATQHADTYGWLKLTLKPDGQYDWQFVRTGGREFSDSGSR